MSDLFISHSSRDDDFVRDLRAALADHGLDGWIDSRQLRGGDPLWTEIQKSIEDASGYAVVVSTDSLQSKWVGKELMHALAVRDQRGKDKFPVVPLSLNGTKLGMLENFFGEEPIYISVSSDAGGVEAAMNAILVALGKRLHADVPATAQPKAEPLEELVLELTDFKFLEKDGDRRASARARLVYQPATPGQEDVRSAQSWRLTAPAIDAVELRWYLEKYAPWPSPYFRHRARKVEENLVEWGKLLYQAALPVAYTADVLKAWARIDDDADRRFSIYVDTTLEADAPEEDVKTAKEAAGLLLALPWELLHDGDGYLFQGAKPVRVRRRLPNTKVLDVPVVATPIRILLITARPEDDSCAFIDHRTSALPMVEAMESLPGFVKIQVLSPPTLPALRAELEQARTEKKPYHVVHFDGHSLFDHEVGKGGLCFEHPEDKSKLSERRHLTVFADELGPLLRDHRIPLFFLEACQTAQAERGSESVASELLKVGVASVVAMSHIVLVETTRRFVEAFYDALAAGQRVGDAMLAGQRALKDDTFRGTIFGAGEFRLEDWFVPVLYQEKDDPQLFKVTPAKQTVEDFRTALVTRLGDLPPEPEIGFIGRSRELLALQRLLRDEPYAVLRGQAGEGKTALAAEYARWMVRSQQVHRAAFVSAERHRNQQALIDALGKQLIKKDFSAPGDPEDAIKQIERALREQSTLLVLDGMESVLLSPFAATETPVSQEASEELKAMLALCERLLKAGDTRVIFTSREAMPAPFDAERNRGEIYQLDWDSAVKLVERMLAAAGTSREVEREEIEQLVDAIHCHAHTLALLAPSLRKLGVEVTRESLAELMAEMEKNFPGNREKSVFASVKLSLQRMSKMNQDRARVLGLFQGGVDLDVLRQGMQWEEADVTSLASELIETGLATPSLYNYLFLHPALCPYLRGMIDPTERERLTAEWVNAMREYVEVLRQQRGENVKAATATLTLWELPNLFALLNLVQSAGNAEDTIELATSLYELLETLARPRLLAHVCDVRDAAAAALGDVWSHMQFEATRTRIEQQLVNGRIREAIEGAQNLHQRAMETRDEAYPDADYDRALASFLLARALKMFGSSEQALPLLDDALQRFENIAQLTPGRGAEEMSAVCFSEQSECLSYLGRLEKAVEACLESIRRAQQLGDDRQVAVSKGQIGTIYTNQGLYSEALQAHAEARELFMQLNEPGSVAADWHDTGILYEAAEEPDLAEDAYRNSLSMRVQLGDVAGQGATLNQLGNLYVNILGRFEDAVTFYQDAVRTSVESGDILGEARGRNNLGNTLSRLRRFDEARQEILRAIECELEFGHAAEPWTTWANLAQIEIDANNLAASVDPKRQAVACYLAYRRDGGENRYQEGVLSLEVTEYLLAGDDAAATSRLEELTVDPELPGDARAFVDALQAIVAGGRDASLADAPDMGYLMAAEILFLLERLENLPSPKKPKKQKKHKK